MKHTIEIHTLKNGLKVAFVNVQNVETVTIHLKGLAGSNYETAQQIGCAHLVEHLSLQSSKTNTLNTLTSLGCKYYGVTSRDTVLYMCKGLNKHTGKIIQLLFNIFTLSKFTNEQLEKTKSIAISEQLRRIEYPEKLIGMKIYGSLFSNHRITQFNTGNEKQISNVTLENCIQFKKQHYFPKNFILVISGNFNKSDAYKKIISTFGKIKSNVNQENYRLDLMEFRSQKYGKPIRLNEIKSLQFHIMAAWAIGSVPLTSEIDYQICSALLEQSLIEKLKIEMGLSYNVSCNYFNSQNYGLFGIYASCTPENSKDLTTNIFDVVNSYSNKKIQPTTLKTIKNKIKTEYVFNLEKVSGLAEYYSEHLLFGNEIIYPETLMSLIDKFTIQKAEEAFAKLFMQKPKIIYISDTVLDIK